MILYWYFISFDDAFNDTMATNREVEVLGCTSEEFVHDGKKKRSKSFILNPSSSSFFWITFCDLVCRMLESSIFDGVDFVEENLIQVTVGCIWFFIYIYKRQKKKNRL